MAEEVPGESNRIRRLFREGFTFQISLDTAHVSRGLAVAEAALAAGVTILELGTPLLKYEGVRNVVPIFRQRFPGALLLADMKTMDGGEGEANAVYGGGGNIIDFLALAGEATALGVCAVRDTLREADPAITEARRGHSSISRLNSASSRHRPQPAPATSRVSRTT
jgi:3-hexulose-6-phosphate synthase